MPAALTEPPPLRKRIRHGMLGASLWFSSSACALDDWGNWLSVVGQTNWGGSKYLAFLELQPRWKDGSGRLQQFIIRPLLGYQSTQQASVWLGYTWQGEYTEGNFDLATNDLLQQLQWSDQLTEHLGFQYRGRLEQRFFAGESEVGWRFRHRFRFEYGIPDTAVYLVGFDELFFYFNSISREQSPRLARTVQQGVNQNRTYIGVGYKITPGIKVDTGYQLQWVNNHGGVQDLLNHTWLTNVQMTF